MLALAESWGSENRQKLGTAFVYPSDEWYLVAGREIPPAQEYDGFPQVENGVGLVRQLLDEWEVLKSDLPALARSRATLVCGALVSPVLSRIVHELNTLTGAAIRLVPVINQYFGSVTTVSGLLTGQDVADALHGRPLGEIVLLPRAMFTGRYGAGSAPPGITLDGWTLEDISSRAGSPVEMAGTMTEVVGALS